MTVIPLSVFALVVVAALGGPVAFVNVVSIWVTDLATCIMGWMKSF